MGARGGSFASPADQAAAVTPNDSTGLEPTRGLYIGTGGNVAVMMAGADRTVITHKNVPTGSVLPISVIKVMATNTTATDIVAWF